MKSIVRQPAAPAGLRGTARVSRRTDELLARLRPGDVAVIDHLDLDRATAAALVARGVVAVVNAAPMVSGRFPNLGPQHLVESGVVMIDGIGAEGLGAIPDGAAVVLANGSVYADQRAVATGRRLDAESVAEEMARARAGMATQLDNFVRNSAEFLRREEDLLLHGQGAPSLRTDLAGRPVVIVSDAPGCRRELARIKTFVREQRAVLVGVARGADVLVAAGWQPDIVVVDAEPGELDTPSAAALKRARDVVVRVERGAGSAAADRVARLGIRPVTFASGVTPEDAALLLGQLGGASLLVGVGRTTTLEEFLDRRHPGLASSYLTRLKVGARLVDAAMIPDLYTGRVRRWHLWTVTLIGLVAVAAAIAVTPVGQDWLAELWRDVAGLAERRS